MEDWRSGVEIKYIYNLNPVIISKLSSNRAALSPCPPCSTELSATVLYLLSSLLSSVSFRRWIQRHAVFLFGFRLSEKPFMSDNRANKHPDEDLDHLPTFILEISKSFQIYDTKDC